MMEPVQAQRYRTANVFIDHPACEAFWREYLARLPADHPHHSATPDAFGFGDEPILASELAELMLAGRKRATTGLSTEFAALGAPLPRAGDLSIVVHGDGRPAALIELTKVDSVPFDEVDEAYAAVEGEGDGSLAYWRDAHERYFNEVCRRLGGRFDGRTPVICQTFRVVWTQGA
jgi:uncharacterized protein YhfF